MNAALAKAIELLERHSPGRFDVWALAGPSGRKARAALMETLLGHRLPQAKCGVNALQAEFYRQAGIVGDCPAHRQAKFAEFCKLARAAEGTILARRMGDFYEFTGSYAQEAAEALGRKAVFTKQRGEIDPQWHFGVPYHERGRLEDALLAKGCLLSVPGESAPEAIATPMAPSPIEATLFPPEAPSVAPVAPQVPPATTEGVVVVEKQPWERLRYDYAVSRAKSKSRGPMQKWYSGEQAQLYRQHERAVRKALAEGKPVPPEVLADYPDLI